MLRPQSIYSVHVAAAAGGGGGSLQQHASEIEVPTARATLRPYAYVGLPVDHPDDSRPPPLAPLAPLAPPSYASYSAAESRIGELPRVHGDVSLGVGRDLAGADIAARHSARKDNAAFVENKG